jgi:hypothetical protein
MSPPQTSLPRPAENTSNEVRRGTGLIGGRVRQQSVADGRPVDFSLVPASAGGRAVKESARPARLKRLRHAPIPCS